MNAALSLRRLSPSLAKKAASSSSSLLTLTAARAMGSMPTPKFFDYATVKKVKPSPTHPPTHSNPTHPYSFLNKQLLLLLLTQLNPPTHPPHPDAQRGSSVQGRRGGLRHAR